MSKFEIKSIEDLLELYEIDELTDEDLIAYGEAVCAFGDSEAENLDQNEKDIVLQAAKYAKTEAELRVSRRKIDALGAQRDPPAPRKISSKNYTQVLLMAIFLGFLGIHRFAVGKTGTGVLWLLTGGLLGIGWFVDVVWLLGNCFDDWEGALLVSEKGKARIAAQGYGAERNAVPEVFCWVYIVASAVTAVGLLARASIAGTGFPPFVWFLLYSASVCYPAALAWLISGKGLD